MVPSTMPSTQPSTLDGRHNNDTAPIYMVMAYGLHNYGQYLRLNQTGNLMHQEKMLQKQKSKGLHFPSLAGGRFFYAGLNMPYGQILPPTIRILIRVLIRGVL